MTEEQKANMRKWVEALRSGEYQQGRGVLRENDNRFCCLGVACEVYRLITSTGFWTVEAGSSLREFGSSDDVRCASLPPYEVSWFFGLPSNTVLPNGNSLTRLNDTGASFDEIANILEEVYQL